MSTRQWNSINPGNVCGFCEEDMYFSGCAAPTCNGWGCPDCGTGCDLDFTGEDGICATELREHKEGGHTGHWRKIGELEDGSRVYFCVCGTNVVDDETGFGNIREATEEEMRYLRGPLPDVSAL